MRFESFQPLYSLFIIHYSLFIIHYSLFIIHYSLFIIHYSLFIAYSLPRSMVSPQCCLRSF
ncbi:MAG: hypothetical protein DRQ44_01485 [Gammaproteobacteria bacterium]|nr:MAG: hypothetical protein DRQ44_01485 [Gammaproteobacteria bacterium]